MPVLRGGTALGADRPCDGDGYAGAAATGSEELHGGGAPVRAVWAAGARATSGCGGGSIWGDRASGRPAREGGGACGPLRHGGAGAEGAGDFAGIHRGADYAECPYAGCVEEGGGGD